MWCFLDHLEIHESTEDTVQIAGHEADFSAGMLGDVLHDAVAMTLVVREHHQHEKVGWLERENRVDVLRHEW